MPGFSKRLVIDACVARASGGEAAIHPTSKQYRDFLKAVLEISHRVVVTPDIRTEWDKHQSKFARLWLVTMGRKGKIVYANIDADRELRSKMETYAENSGLSVKEILKDLHLLEAAFGTDEGSSPEVSVISSKKPRPLFYRSMSITPSASRSSERWCSRRSSMFR